MSDDPGHTGCVALTLSSLPLLESTWSASPLHPVHLQRYGRNEVLCIRVVEDSRSTERETRNGAEKSHDEDVGDELRGGSRSVRASSAPESPPIGSLCRLVNDRGVPSCPAPLRRQGGADDEKQIQRRAPLARRRLGRKSIGRLPARRPKNFSSNAQCRVSESFPSVPISVDASKSR